MGRLGSVTVLAIWLYIKIGAEFTALQKSEGKSVFGG